MIMGIALFGFLAGVLASFSLEQREEETDEARLADISARLDRIENLLLQKEQQRD
jgi:hypothetical protein